MYLTPDQANLPKGVCIADGCDLRVAGVSRVRLCIHHTQMAWEDMNAAWDEQANQYPNRDLTSPVSQRKSFVPGAGRRPWVVYYIRMGERVKIGRTSDLVTRMRTFYAQPEQLLAVEPGVIIEGLDRETQRHHEFAKWRVPGTELFEMSPEVTSHIDVVRATFGEPTRYLDVA